MICHDTAENKRVIDRLREWHRSAEAHPENIDIEYGWYKGRVGAIRLERGQFMVKWVSRVKAGAESFVEVSYNHEFDTSITPKAIEEALKCNDLAADTKKRSLVILMTSECARSEVVEKFIAAISKSVAMDSKDFSIITELTKSYEKTQKLAGRDISTGPGWHPLTIEDHRKYQKTMANEKNAEYLDDLWTKIEKADA